MNALCVFAVIRGNIKLNATERLDPKCYSIKFQAIRSRLEQTNFTKYKLKDLITDITSGDWGADVDCVSNDRVKCLVLRATEISNNDNISIRDDKAQYRQIDQKKLKAMNVEIGDIIIEKSGGSPDQPVGRVIYVDTTFYNDCPIAYSNFLTKIKVNRELVDPYYLFEYLRFVYRNRLTEVMQNQTNGIRNLIIDEFLDQTVIVPDNNYDIGCRMQRRRVEIKNFERQANEQIAYFYESISRSFDLNKHFNNDYFAIRLKQLDGVIDVKRYKNMGSNHNLTLGGVCDIVEQKVNVGSFGTKILDWIRIDDLPNFPLDIEQVRTQQANEIDGSFFEVNENDILLARLGPTIQNKKIVLVRRLQRQTIASSEFLVLRCKEGYNPEAVMAILKTDYYKNLMYSYARGSTPSRYRLNREDALKLPFPEIADAQDDLAQNAVALRAQVKALREQATQAWQAAKVQFEKEILEI